MRYTTSFCPILGPMGIHQNSETSVSHPQRNGRASDSLYWQLINSGGVQGVDRISWSVCGYNSHTNQASISKNQIQGIEIVSLP